jgi:alkaline phosphatase
MNKITLCLFLISSVCFSQTFEVHSHNDYEQIAPFWTAYDAGCSSIEVDVFLIDGQLMVSHIIDNIAIENTLEKLFLEPLQEIIGKQKKEIQLLIDVKTEPLASLAAIVTALTKYPDLIAGNSKIRFAISGNRPDDEKYKNYPNFINFDYQSIKTWPANMDKVALVSLPFYSHSFWKGDVTLSEKDKEKLKESIGLVHSKGKKIRFWATPDTELAWHTLYDLGIDYINTDKPKECFDFLASLKKSE